MYIIPFNVGKYLNDIKSIGDLEHDILLLLIKYGAKENSISDSGATPLRRQDVIYEIPNKGAIRVVLSNHRDIVSVNKSYYHVDGVAICVGFDERSEFFKELNEDFIGLAEIYNDKRKLVNLK